MIRVIEQIRDIVKRWMLRIRKSGVNGKGVFALEPIGRDTRVFRFSRRRMKVESIVKKYGSRFLDRCLEIDDYGHEALPSVHSFAWYLNHSCNPNCGVDGIYIVAMRDIRRGEELTIDYSTTLCDNSWTMECSCGARNCRKHIGSFFDLPKKTRERYKGYCRFLKK